MKESEVKELAARVLRYRELEKVRDEIATAIKEVTKPWPDTGPSGQGPFTGNTRESRQVQDMTIRFTQTRGGACAVDTEIRNLHIEAWQLGRALESLLRAKLETVNADMENL